MATLPLASFLALNEWAWLKTKGDKTSWFCLLDEEGAVVDEGSVATNKGAMLQTFGARPRCLIVMEVGTHSPWVSRLLKPQP